MQPTYTCPAHIHRGGQEYSAEVMIRFLPAWGGAEIGDSSEVQRYFNSTIGTDREECSDVIWHAVANAFQAGSWRLAKRPELNARSFRAQVLRVQLTEGASRGDTEFLFAEASKLAVERYFADLDSGLIDLKASDTEQPFEYLPSTGFDEEFISRRQCFLEYVAEKRPGFLVGYHVDQSISIEQSQQEQSLAPRGESALDSAVFGYLCGCRPEADALVSKAHELLTLADATHEKPAGDSVEFDLGHRFTALAYVHWLRTGETHREAIAKARRNFLSYYRRTKQFDRRTANLAAPELLFLGADSVLTALAERLAANPGRGAATPGGLFGDALRIATAPEETERDRLRAKLRKRMPLHLFRWMDRGQHRSVACMLHAIFPRPEGPPSRLIERAWDFMPEIRRSPGVYRGWDVARKSSRNVSSTSRHRGLAGAAEDATPLPDWPGPVELSRVVSQAGSRSFIAEIIGAQPGTAQLVAITIKRKGGRLPRALVYVGPLEHDGFKRICGLIDDKYRVQQFRNVTTLRADPTATADDPQGY